MIFSISLLLITLSALIGTLLIVSKLEGIISGASFIGGSSSAVLRAYADQQAVLFQVDQIAKYALVDALEKLAENGGGVAGCSETLQNNKQYTLWNSASNNQEIKCYKTAQIDDLLKNKFVKSFETQYQLISAEGNPLNGNDYDFFVEPNPLTLHGIAQVPFQLPITLGETQTGALSFSPSFKVKIAYDFRIYDALYAFADTVLANCPTTDDKQTCIKNVMTKVPQEYTVLLDGNSEDTYLFTANTVQLYENPYTEEAIPSIRFALSLI